jgi:hypothetical protein
MFPKSTFRIFDSEYCYSVLRCFDEVMSGKSIGALLTNYMFRDLKGLISVGDFVFFKNMKLGFMVCLDDDNKIDLDAYQNSLSDAIIQINDYSSKIQIVHPKSNFEVEIMKRILNASQQEIDSDNFSGEVSFVTIDDLQEFLGIEKLLN